MNRWVLFELRVVAVVLIVLLVTPYNRGTLLNWMDMAAGVVGALTQLATAGHLARRAAPTSSRAALVVILFGAVAALSLPDGHFVYRLEGEIILEVGFAWSLGEWTKEVSASSTWALRDEVV